MADMAERIEPLAQRVFAANGVTLTPLEPCERISLRCTPDAMGALGRAVGIGLPKKPGSRKSKGNIEALWLGPDEWFLSAPAGTDLEGRFSGVKSKSFSAVAIDHRNTGLTVSGPNAVNALNSGCPRDLSLEAFPVGTGSRTLLGKAEILLLRNAEDTFRVECWRSFSDYVWKYLVTAARSA